MLDSITSRLQPVAQELFAAWSRLPRHGGVPPRDSFDPMSIARILPVVSLIERFSDEEWRMRVVGTEIERRWGRSLTGLDYRQITSPAAAAATLREFAAVCAQPCGSWAMRHLKLESGRRVDAETLRLPLRARDGSVSLILSCSGELSGRFQEDSDRRREVITLIEQQFLDIGAGIPAAPCVLSAT